MKTRRRFGGSAWGPGTRVANRFGRGGCPTAFANIHFAGGVRGSGCRRPGESLEGNPIPLRSRASWFSRRRWRWTDVRDSTRAAAIAPDKTALLPGQVATFANYTIYDKGINGVMVDVANLPAVGVSAADFTFTAGTSSTPGSWAAVPVPSSVTVFRGVGVGGRFDGSPAAESVSPAKACLRDDL